MLRELARHGMDVARLNFSHGTHAEHGRRVDAIREVVRELGREVGIMLDTRGQEIRIGAFAGGRAFLHEGDEFILTTRQVEGDCRRVSISFPERRPELKPGMRVFVADGYIELEVLRTADEDIVCRVVSGGELTDRKGVNVPAGRVTGPAIAQRDVEDIMFGVAKEVDFIAVSFVRRAADVLEVRKLVERSEAEVDIIAKIERREAVEKIDEIIKVADGVMVARGDLGVELPPEEVPLVQKAIIERCNRAGKPVITATQMLESMMHQPRPTRAEVTDISNAIFDGTDAIMLSGETAAGQYPVEALKTMARVAERTEEDLRFREVLARRSVAQPRTVTDAISHATCQAATDLGAAAIITSTSSGYTARMVSKYRPLAPIVAVTPRRTVVRRLSLVWGVRPLIAAQTESTDAMIREAVQGALGSDLVKQGDLVVITAGVPVGVKGTTNLLKVHVVGDVLLKGTGIGARAVTGRVCVAKTAKEALAKFTAGSILVTVGTDREFMPVLEKAAGIVAEEGGLTSHAAIVGLNLGIPVVVGADGATGILSDGMLVTLDGTRGLVYKGEARVL